MKESVIHLFPPEIKDDIEKIYLYCNRYAVGMKIKFKTYYYDSNIYIDRYRTFRLSVVCNSYNVYFTPTIRKKFKLFLLDFEKIAREDMF